MTERIITDSNGRKHITTEPLRPRLDQSPDYERGFVDGMLYQTQISIDKAVNAMAQPPEARNFCPRCGKRRGGDVNYIHTCTPPRGLEMT